MSTNSLTGSIDSRETEVLLGTTEATTTTVTTDANIDSNRTTNMGSLEDLENTAHADRERLRKTIELYKTETRSQRAAAHEYDAESLTHSVQHSLTMTDDFTDADDFIVNKSDHDGSEHGVQLRQHTPPDQQLQIDENDNTEIAPVKLQPPRANNQNSPSTISNRMSIISDYAGSIHEVSQVKYVVDQEQSPSAESTAALKKPVVKISRNPSKNTKKDTVAGSSSESTSGSSRYPVSMYSANNEASLVKPIAEERKTSTDSFDFGAGQLKTTKRGQAVGTERSHITALDPTIPSRSPRRPVSMVITGDIPPPPVDTLPHHGRAKSVDDFVPEKNAGPRDILITSSKKDPRPLPPPPVPQHKSKKSTTTDDGFVTEDETTDPLTSKKKRLSKKRKSKHHPKKFSEETLMQMLQVTEGTIIGQEFQNIGLEPLDKQLLERLVDSLSRLTADMIVDPDRHEESVKRLNKAIKALEGF